MIDGTVRTLTVEQLNTYIKDYLGTSPLLSKVVVKGEMSNVRVYGGSGHIYFTLKDENSAIPATMFGGAGKLPFKPENGMKVICTGRVAVFVRDGQYRLYADAMEPDGVGSLCHVRMQNALLINDTTNARVCQAENSLFCRKFAAPTFGKEYGRWG